MSIANRISGFGTGDTIELLGIAANRLNYAGGVLTVKSGSTAITSLHFAGTYTPANFAIHFDAATDTTTISYVKKAAAQAGDWPASVDLASGVRWLHGAAADGAHPAGARAAAISWRMASRPTRSSPAVERQVDFPGIFGDDRRHPAGPTGEQCRSSSLISWLTASSSSI